mgnify:CR=1 FL=1
MVFLDQLNAKILFTYYLVISWKLLTIDSLFSKNVIKLWI